MEAVTGLADRVVTVTEGTDVVSALTSIERFATKVRDEAKLPAPVPYAAH